MTDKKKASEMTVGEGVIAGLKEIVEYEKGQKKPKEFYCIPKNLENKEDTGFCLAAPVTHGAIKGLATHVIEKKAYDEVIGLLRGASDALEYISKTKYGLDLSDTDEEIADYFSKTIVSYEKEATTALTKILKSGLLGKKK